jgi:hypothetical protein
MSLKRMVMELLQSPDTTRLEKFAAAEPRAMRFLLGRLWDPDETMRGRAAVGIGASAAVNRDLGVDVIRRLVWALNDESATNGVFGLAAIGEIGARDPDLIEPFVGPVACYAWDDGLRLEIIRALSRIADTAPRLVAPFLDEIKQRVDRRDATEVALVAELSEKVEI